MSRLEDHMDLIGTALNEADHTEALTTPRPKDLREAALVEKYDGFMIAARGLIVLSGLLVESEAQPDGWATYKGLNPRVPTYDRKSNPSALAGKRMADGVAIVNHTRPKIRGLTSKDPYWKLREYKENMKNGVIDRHKHSLLTGTRMIIADDFLHSYLDLDLMHQPTDAARLEALSSPTATTPADLGRQIVWTMMHFDLRWPASAPDIMDIL